jgi:hypothetical protein
MRAFWGGVNGRLKNRNGMLANRARVAVRNVSWGINSNLREAYFDASVTFQPSRRLARHSFSSGNKRLNLFKLGRANARDAHDFVDSGKRAVAVPVFYDLFGCAGANAGQGV